MPRPSPSPPTATTVSSGSAILAPLAKLLDKKLDELRQLLARRSDRSFVYLERQVPPHLAEQFSQIVKEQEIPGVGLQREYRRYYPGSLP